jgi:acyl-CoA synthetase (AMP-forming)/AMP-acid ligase II
MFRTIVDEILAVAEGTPSAPALSWHKSVWRYRDVASAVRRVRARLASVGVANGDRVAILMRNSPHYAAAFFGTLAAGGAAVPLNVQERANVVARQIAHVDCRAVIVDSEHPEWRALTAQLESSGRSVLPVAVRDDVDSHAVFCAAMAGGEELPTERSNEAALAMVLHTSGTTARPKAVMLSHGNLSANARAIAEYLEITATDVVLCVLPFHFSYGASVLNSNLLCGANVLLEDNFAFPHLVLKRVQEARVTGLPGVPSTFALLLGRCRLADFDLEHLRYITQAGGPMPKAHMEQLRADAPGARLYVMYGQSEATARLTYLPPEKLDEKLGSVGIPLPGTAIEIRRAGAVVPPGESGEICARGPGVMMGYWGDPELSASVLEAGWLHTGDLGHFDDDGYLYIDGRASEMIKVGAFRVSPQEVEEVIATFPGVEEVGVTGVADALLGQAIKAVVVMRAGAEPNQLAIKAHCRAHLAAYKVPKTVDFAGQLPRTSSGKIQRYSLA